jgi:NAD(P)-dependent dehydrogenase (short-subunit alcohol dehydrogenase family)
MSGPLEGRVALVTGASRGIGKAIARALAEAGADLVLTSTQPGGVRAVAQEAGQRGRRVLELAGDVARREDVERWTAEVEASFGRVDVLVNNAAIIVRRPVVEMSDDDFDRVLAVNLSGPFYLVRRWVPGMVARGWGRIVNVSSISGTLGSPRASGYCASKWGLNGLTKSLAEELEGTGVMVAAVLPGSVDTDMLKGSGFEPAMTADEVARLVRFLCAEAPTAMTGSLVEIFG